MKCFLFTIYSNTFHEAGSTQQSIQSLEAAHENAKAFNDKCEKHVTWFVP